MNIRHNIYQRLLNHWPLVGWSCGQLVVESCFFDHDRLHIVVGKKLYVDIDINRYRTESIMVGKISGSLYSKMRNAEFLRNIGLV